MKNEPRILTICSSIHRQPQIIIRGAWFRNYGFSIGEQITVTNPQLGTLVMKMTKAADEWYAEKMENSLVERQKALQREAPDLYWDSDRKRRLDEITDIQRELDALKENKRLRA